MSVPRTVPVGPQMWVRGPTVQEPFDLPAEPAEPAGPAYPAEPAWPDGWTEPDETAVTAEFDEPVLDDPVLDDPVLDDPDGIAPPGGHEVRPERGHSFAWVSAHGGAGASTLAQVLGGADVGRRWPDTANGEPAQMMLVARTHAAGLQAASKALDALRKREHPPGLELLALVLVADAPKNLPTQLARRVRVLRSAARIQRVPWIPAWRVGGQPEKLPKEVLALADLTGTRPRRLKENR